MITVDAVFLIIAYISAAFVVCYVIVKAVRSWWRKRDERIRIDARHQALSDYAILSRREPEEKVKKVKVDTGPISYDDYAKALSNLRFVKALNTIKDLSAERLPRIVCRKEEDTVSRIFKLADKALNPNK